ncbi:hypothetical protein ADUPG1_007098, partial [Aduncisulcus paluster]
MGYRFVVGDENGVIKVFYDNLRKERKEAVFEIHLGKFKEDEFKVTSLTSCPSDPSYFTVGSANGRLVTFKLPPEPQSFPPSTAPQIVSDITVVRVLKSIKDIDIKRKITEETNQRVEHARKLQKRKELIEKTSIKENFIRSVGWIHRDTYPCLSSCPQSPITSHPLSQWALVVVTSQLLVTTFTFHPDHNSDDIMAIKMFPRVISAFHLSLSPHHCLSLSFTSPMCSNGLLVTGHSILPRLFRVLDGKELWRAYPLPQSDYGSERGGRWECACTVVKRMTTSKELDKWENNERIMTRELRQIKEKGLTTMPEIKLRKAIEMNSFLDDSKISALKLKKSTSNKIGKRRSSSSVHSSLTKEEDQKVDDNCITKVVTHEKEEEREEREEEEVDIVSSSSSALLPSLLPSLSLSSLSRDSVFSSFPISHVCAGRDESFVDIWEVDERVEFLIRGWKQKEEEEKVQKEEGKEGKEGKEEDEKLKGKKKAVKRGSLLSAALKMRKKGKKAPKKKIEQDKKEDKKEEKKEEKEEKRTR